MTREEINDWLADAQQWERRFETLRELHSYHDHEIEERREVIIKDGHELRVIWHGLEVRHYDENHSLIRLYHTPFPEK